MARSTARAAQPWVRVERANTGDEERGDGVLAEPAEVGADTVGAEGGVKPAA
ncbi:hypothetical protein FBY35_5812 [Streptomyces sp. SLBN-118]|uniref:hypothetical protein n=1 Tax=Streptomyces sp. SLBN-118 TaxID=2768454 RepID=UPI00116A5E9F|nr:hypothetical protein [Streptomyces sp. SLBN-118]TQK44318.1 hypothetical protein FBY35_5812 [Streptomyces sp. SLBN-118]